jgi:hypothetical protein
LLHTQHRFKFWDVETAYRGPVDGYNYKEDAGKNNVTGLQSKQRCPNISKSWVVMPTNTITDNKRVGVAQNKLMRMKQWYEFCRNEINVTSGD